MLRKELKIEVISEFEAAEVNSEDFLPFLEIRQLYMNLAVKTAGTHESLVKNVSSVCSGKNDYAGIRSETIHFSKQLIEGVFTLIVR